MGWMLVVILLAPNPAAQANPEYNTKIETYVGDGADAYNDCLVLRHKVLDQYIGSLSIVREGERHNSFIETEKNDMVHATCVPVSKR
jgi:hypothetical protein